MIAARLERDEVRALLRATAVLDRYGVAGRRNGPELRTKVCPQCGPRSRDAVAVNLSTGMWFDHAHGCHGDVLALLAGLAGLDLRTQFGDVLQLGAEIAGIDVPAGDEAERGRRRSEIMREAEQRRQRETAEGAARRAHAITRASSIWMSLATRSVEGEAYLAARGVADVLRFNIVRFTRAGDIAVALRNADGQLVNVVRRRRGVGDPKILGEKECPIAGSFVDAIIDITPGRDVVIVEGVFDALTARLAWPAAVILGAHGAVNIPKIAAVAAPRVRDAGGRLALVPDRDDAGQRRAIEAGTVSLDSGLQMDRSLRVFDVAPHHDLNDAYRAGWRP